MRKHRGCIWKASSTAKSYGRHCLCKEHDFVQDALVKLE